MIDQKEESTSIDMPLGMAIHNIDITLRKRRYWLRRPRGGRDMVGRALGNLEDFHRTTGAELAGSPRNALRHNSRLDI